MDFITQITTEIETKDNTLKRSDVFSKDNLSTTFVLDCLRDAIIQLVGGGGTISIKSIKFEVKVL